MRFMLSQPYLGQKYYEILLDSITYDTYRNFAALRNMQEKLANFVISDVSELGKPK